jgi:hypothetical protein
MQPFAAVPELNSCQPCRRPSAELGFLNADFRSKDTSGGPRKTVLRKAGTLM